MLVRSLDIDHAKSTARAIGEYVDSHKVIGLGFERTPLARKATMGLGGRRTKKTFTIVA